MNTTPADHEFRRELALLQAFESADKLARYLGNPNPKIAVAGLNPHASEDGLFGHEESDIIAPAIDLFKSKGHDITGPYPGDTIFMRASKGEFDVVVAMYHDQGLIPVKLLGFYDFNYDIMASQAIKTLVYYSSFVDC